MRRSAALFFMLPLLAGAAEEAPSSDLRPELRKAGITVRAQGKRGTCSVFTVTSAMEYALAKSGHEVAAPAGRLSVEYLNWASNEAVGQAQDGGFFSDLWKGYQARGICREEAMPYAAAFDPAGKPTEAAVKEGKAEAMRLRMNWIKPWNVKTGLTPAEFTAIRETLAKGWPVCSGLRWPKKEQWQEGVLKMCAPEDVFDGHSVLITGCEPDPAQPGGGTLSFYNTAHPTMECRMTWEYAQAYMNDAMWIEPVER